jgi:wyosine [tRNA(Phe)-imidazoG37] synthetase (radical SAM superfamily)
MQTARRQFYNLERIVRDVQSKVENAQKAGEPIEYLTFVPDGEPTLDINLGYEIKSLKRLGFPIAVITNSSLIWREDVRTELAQADWVSLKIDAVLRDTWRRVNRPHKKLQLASIQDGMLRFARSYDGKLVTETMLVKGINDGEDHLRKVAEFLACLKPEIAYLSIPTRPPAEVWAHAPDEGVINRAYQMLSEKVERVEYLIGYEGNAFAFTGNIEEDLLSITAVHPMRKDAVSEFLGKARGDWSAIHELVAQNQLLETEYGGKKFYLRRLRKPATDNSQNWS